MLQKDVGGWAVLGSPSILFIKSELQAGRFDPVRN